MMLSEKSRILHALCLSAVCQPEGLRSLRMLSGDASFNIIFGSASGARRKVPDDMGYELTVVTADIDEKAIRKDDPEDPVMSLAQAKIAEGIVLKSAGGLIIEHPSIVPYVKRVVGTTDSMMGLPKDLTKKLIKDAL